MLAGRLCSSQCELVVLPPRLFSIHSIVTVSHIGEEARARQRRGDRVGKVRQRGPEGGGGGTWHKVAGKKKPSLITPKDNYFLDLFYRLLVTFPFVLLVFLLLFTYLSILCVSIPPSLPPCLHHMVADQIMSNILPLQSFFFFFFLNLQFPKCETCWKPEW